MTGLPLASTHERWPAWIDNASEGDTGGGGSDFALMFWSVMLPAGWHWSGAPVVGDAATLADADGSLAMEELITLTGWRWIQIDGPASALVNGEEPLTAQQEDGSILLFHNFAQPTDGDHSNWWELEGNVAVRGWVADESTLAGPSPLVPPAVNTSAGMKAFHPSTGICCINTDEGCWEAEPPTDDTGESTSTGDAPPVEQIEPCEIIGDALGEELELAPTFQNFKTDLYWSTAEDPTILSYDGEWSWSSIEDGNSPAMIYGGPGEVSIGDAGPVVHGGNPIAFIITENAPGSVDLAEILLEPTTAESIALDASDALLWIVQTTGQVPVEWILHSGLRPRGVVTEYEGGSGGGHYVEIDGVSAGVSEAMGRGFYVSLGYCRAPEGDATSTGPTLDETG